VKVCILNAYTRRNAGDAVLLASLISQVRVAFPGCEVVFSGLEHPSVHPEFEQARNLGSIRRWAGDEQVSTLVRVGRKLAALFLLVLPASVIRWIGQKRLHGWEPVEEVRAVESADLVLGLGGGYLNGAPSLAGTLNVLFLVLPILLATRLGKAVILAPQSYGPFGWNSQEVLTRRTLSRVRHVEVREDVSLAALIEIGVSPSIIRRGVDSAFVGVSDPGRESDRPAALREAVPGGPMEGALVGITLRRFLADEAQQSYESEMAAFIDWLLCDRGCRVVILPQVVSDYRGDDDRVVARRVAALCRVADPCVIDAWVPHEKLRSMYGELDYMVGTRFHSVIFSLTALVPALAIEYEHKTSGIMRDLELEQWVLPMDGLAANDIQVRFDALIAGRAEYVEHLRRVLPAYRRRADEFVEVMRGITGTCPGLQSCPRS
jgi:colanic acid/amylovoran biosynthesis protein